jgi:F0F1-type ATP synthase delta subunit
MNELARQYALAAFSRAFETKEVELFKNGGRCHSSV